tara:strand:- start:521 stop:1390 length:870 start_codon:yes stop_codon:yes gene_type:complete
MPKNLTIYTLAEINELAKNFKAVLDKEIIEKLAVIRNNSKFFKYENPIRLKYTRSDWRGDDEVEVEMSQEVFESNIVSNLNKLAKGNYKVIKNKINVVITTIQKEDINTNTLVDILFDKAAEENMYSDMYSKLMGDLILENEMLHDLKEYINEKCEEFYDGNVNLDIVELDSSANYNEMCETNKNKKLMLGGIIFISNLFNYKLISYDWVKKYYCALVKMTKQVGKDHIGIYIDTLCAILSTSGKNLQRYSTEDFNENFMDSLIEFSKDRKRLKPKYRFKIKDITDEYQ